MKKNYTLIILLFNISVFAQSDITFSVDMSGETFTTAYVSGSFNDWSGTATPLNDMGGGIYEVTLSLAPGEYEYKFQYDDWSGYDSFTQGDVCTITNYGNTNRRLVVSDVDQILPTVPLSHCYESEMNPGPHNLTLTVDMATYTGAENYETNGVYVNGEFNGWCGDCTELSNIGGTLYSVTLPLDEKSYQFKFTVNGWADQEEFLAGDIGTSSDDFATNRYIQVDSDKSIVVNWNTPAVLKINEFEVYDFSIYPNPANEVIQLKASKSIDFVEVYDLSGRQVLKSEPNSNSKSMNVSTLSKGVYLVKIGIDGVVGTTKLLKQ